jgi:hypothetical protein
MIITKSSISRDSQLSQINFKKPQMNYDKMNLSKLQRASHFRSFIQLSAVMINCILKNICKKKYFFNTSCN